MIKEEPIKVKYSDIPSRIRSLLRRVGLVKIPKAYQFLGDYTILTHYMDSNKITRVHLKLLYQSDAFVSIEPLALSATKSVFKMKFKDI